MTDPILITFVVVLVLISLVLIPKVLKSEKGEADSLFTNAVLKKQTGSLTEAEYYLQRALEAFEREKPLDFAKFWACLLQLAEVQTKLGRYADSRALYSKLIESWNDVISKDNPEAFLDIDYFASSAEFGAATNEVAECYAKIIDSKQRIFGQNHPDVANSLRIHAILLRRLGRLDEAQEREVEAEVLLARPAPDAHVE